MYLSKDFVKQIKGSSVIILFMKLAFRDLLKCKILSTSLESSSLFFKTITFSYSFCMISTFVFIRFVSHNCQVQTSFELLDAQIDECADRIRFKALRFKMRTRITNCLHSRVTSSPIGTR